MDAKASIQFKKYVKSLVQIFKKQFPETTLILANPTRRIYWGDVSILEAGKNNNCKSSLDFIQYLVTPEQQYSPAPDLS